MTLLTYSYYWNQLGQLFEQFGLVAATMIGLGLCIVLVGLVERIGVALYYIGFGLIALGITVRMLDGGTVFMLFVQLLIVCSIVTVMFVIVNVKSKKAWPIKASSLSVNTEIYEENKGGYEFLVGLEGDAITPLAPTGHIRVQDINFFVTNLGDKALAQGTRVVIDSTKADKIFVRTLEAEEII